MKNNFEKLWSIYYNIYPKRLVESHRLNDLSNHIRSSQSADNVRQNVSAHEQNVSLRNEERVSGGFSVDFPQENHRNNRSLPISSTNYAHNRPARENFYVGGHGGGQFWAESVAANNGNVLRPHNPRVRHFHIPEKNQLNNLNNREQNTPLSPVRILNNIEETEFDNIQTREVFKSYSNKKSFMVINGHL